MPMGYFTKELMPSLKTALVVSSLLQITDFHVDVCFDHCHAVIRCILTVQKYKKKHETLTNPMLLFR